MHKRFSKKLEAKASNVTKHERTVEKKTPLDFTYIAMCRSRQNASAKVVKDLLDNFFIEK